VQRFRYLHEAELADAMRAGIVLDQRCDPEIGREDALRLNAVVT
jgi:hypothetical protein